MLMMSESLSTAFLVILESLKPVERAVFLLHDVFEYDYAEIAGIVDKSEANCRQIASRARRYVAERRPRLETSPTQQSHVVEQFQQTLQNGDVDGLLAVLDKDVTWFSDGGGLPGIARKPVHGAQNVAKFVLNIWKLAPANTAVRLSRLNDRPGIIVYVDGQPFNTLSFDVLEGRITAVYAVVNPEKLGGVPPLN
jgi:RNA polymerase sigma-70 factor (ECF subfamily)